MLFKGLFFNYAVNLDAGIGTYYGAGRATDARLFVGREREMIAAVVNLLGLEGEHVAGTGDHAEVATFAALGIDRHGTVDLTHLATDLVFGWI